MKEWKVELAGQAKKAQKILPKNALNTFFLLVFELKNGPIKKEWPNFSSLKGMKDHYHCHIEKGRPTYVVCRSAGKANKKIEVYYAGTHEKAPY